MCEADLTTCSLCDIANGYYVDNSSCNICLSPNIASAYACASSLETGYYVDIEDGTLLEECGDGTNIA